MSREATKSHRCAREGWLDWLGGTALGGVAAGFFRGNESGLVTVALATSAVVMTALYLAGGLRRVWKVGAIVCWVWLAADLIPVDWLPPLCINRRVLPEERLR